MWTQAFGCFKAQAPDGNAPGGNGQGPDRKGKAKMYEEEEEEQESGEKAKEEEKKEEVPVFGEKENFQALAAEHLRRNRVLHKKVELLGKRYTCFTRIRNDGGLFYRSFLFAYVEHVWGTRDRSEVERIRASLTLCKWTNDVRGKTCANFEELKEMFLRLLNQHIEEESRPRSHQEFLSRSRTRWPLASMVSLLDHVACNELGRQAAEILTSPDTDYNLVHKILGEEPTIPYHRQLSALSDALGVAVRVVFLDATVGRRHHQPKLYHRDFTPKNQWKVPTWSRFPFPPALVSREDIRHTLLAARNVAMPSTSTNSRQPFITLLFRPSSAGVDHYDILYKS